MIGDAIEWIAKSISRGLLAMSVLCGPAFWILSFWFAYLLWRPGISSEMFLSSAYLTFLFAFWAAWGLIGGPMHIRPWWFALASALNAFAGIRIFSGQPSPERWIALLFIAYSLWQFFIFRRPASERLPE
ncbi:MAG: hypothetical protein AAB375_02705 [Patescibacteria group bacterium]